MSILLIWKRNPESAVNWNTILTQFSMQRKEYIASKILTENFYDYWLNEHMVKVRQIKYGTFVYCRNIIQNYILPIMKGKTMDAVTSDDLLKILDSMTPGLLSPAYGVFGSSFKYAQKTRSD